MQIRGLHLKKQMIDNERMEWKRGQDIEQIIEQARSFGVCEFFLVFGFFFLKICQICKCVQTSFGKHSIMNYCLALYHLPFVFGIMSVRASQPAECVTHANWIPLYKNVSAYELIALPFPFRLALLLGFFFVVVDKNRCNLYCYHHCGRAFCFTIVAVLFALRWCGVAVPIFALAGYYTALPIDLWAKNSMHKRPSNV